MSEQRIERWALVAKSGALVTTYFGSRAQAMAEAIAVDGDRIVRLVEIRDGEPHPDDVGMMLADAKLRSDAATERAEKAEKAWRYLVKTIDDANGNERARFERQAAAWFRGIYLANGDGEFSEIDEARKLADIYFGAKEAKGDE